MASVTVTLACLLFVCLPASDFASEVGAPPHLLLHIRIPFGARVAFGVPACGLAGVKTQRLCSGCEVGVASRPLPPYPQALSSQSGISQGHTHVPCAPWRACCLCACLCVRGCLHVPHCLACLPVPACLPSCTLKSACLCLPACASEPRAPPHFLPPNPQALWSQHGMSQGHTCLPCAPWRACCLCACLCARGCLPVPACACLCLPVYQRLVLHCTRCPEGPVEPVWHQSGSYMPALCALACLLSVCLPLRQRLPACGPKLPAFACLPVFCACLPVHQRLPAHA